MENLNKLAENGVLGVILAISFLANYLLFNVIKDLQEKRIVDIKESRDSFMEPVKAIKQTVELILSIVQKNKK